MPILSEDYSILEKPYLERRKDLFLYLYGWLETRTGTEEIQLHQHQMRLPNMGGIPKISLMELACEETVI